jgi:hypothetical protein
MEQYKLKVEKKENIQLLNAETEIISFYKSNHRSNTFSNQSQVWTPIHKKKKRINWFLNFLDAHEPT